MSIILNVQSSPNLTESASRATSRIVIEKLLDKHPGSEVVDLDLVLNPPPHLGVDHIGAFFAPPEVHTPEHTAALLASDHYLDQLFAADIVVIGSPMHNFGIASVLKSWIDNIIRVGKTFRYNELGVVVGMMPQKQIYIVVSTGGIYSAGPMAHFDHAATYLEDIFRFLGMEDVNIIRAEGLSMGPDSAATGMANATAQIEAVAA